MPAFDHEKLKVYFRDGIVEFADANISIANTGFIYGLGVFTGIRAHYNEATKKSYIFRPDKHYRRMVRSCTLCNYTNFLERYDYDAFLNILLELLRVNNLNQDVYIRVTNFSDENLVTPKFIGYRDSLAVYLYPLGDYVPTSGMRCKIASWTRVSGNAIPAGAKFNGVYVNTAFAKTEALKSGYDEAIFLDEDGYVIEGSAENIFIVRNGTLYTPSPAQNILEGIVRNSVIELAADLGIPVVERQIGRFELYAADEVFLTGTGAKISPVVEIDNRPIGSGAVGPIASKLQELYFRLVRGEVPEYASWLVEV